MQAFHLSQPTSLDAALAAAHARDAKFIAGGTDLMQLLKDNVESPTQLVDLEHVGLSRIEVDASGLRLGGDGAHERRRRASGGAAQAGR